MKRESKLMHLHTSTDSSAESNLSTLIGDLLESAITNLDADNAASLENLMRAKVLLNGRATAPNSHQRARVVGLPRWKEQRVIDHIEDNLFNEIRVSQLARMVNLSCSYFVRSFKTSIGTSPTGSVRQRRIELAKTLMRTTNLALAQIALDCGMADQAHLSRLFRKWVRCTPGQWRRANALPLHEGHPLSVPTGTTSPGQTISAAPAP